MTILEIGCCGAYCKTCIRLQKDRYPNERHCSGCKLGYQSGQRDITKAKCKMKVCCFGERKLQTCADCPEYPCGVLLEFYSKKGVKHKQQKKQLEYIKENGYDEFLKHADKWKGPRGKLSSTGIE